MTATNAKIAKTFPMNSKHEIVTNTTYKNNISSNYTEIIEQLEKNFSYEENKDQYWGPVELSIFYGSPLYDQASETQKIALNHLYWITQYNQTASTEANAVLYNQITEGVFTAVGGYDILCKELSLETEQEHAHIRAFHSVGHATRKALFGNTAFTRPKIKLIKINSRHKSTNINLFLPSLNWESLKEDAWKQISIRLSSGNGKAYYSEYLLSLQQMGKRIPVQTTGLLGQVVPPSVSKLLTTNFGSSPFSACFFYATRYMANMILKNWEQRYLQHFKQLEHSGSHIPAPVAISNYHMLDESFHTTISQLISQDLYKEFNNPTIYEQLMANAVFYRGQELLLSGLSGVMPSTFRNDGVFLQPLYRILRSPIFSFDHNSALHWLQRALCEEHDGYHANIKHHHRLITTMRQAFQPLNYFWPVNRQLAIMSSGCSIDRNLRANKKDFELFSKSSEQIKN
jgi:hypothetical protein